MRINLSIVSRSLVVVLIVYSLSTSAAARVQSDAQDAGDDAITISVFESKRNTDALYRWMHPDAQRIVPKSAVVGWYTTDFFPLQPQPISEIISVEFVDWVWPVTGKTYPNTALITFIQPFGPESNRSYQEGVVRLVKSGSDWKWFFGRTAEFVDNQIARFPEKQQSPTRNGSEINQAQAASHDQGTAQRDRVPRGTGCTLVELYPGYPGYRGVITGMLASWGGLGDWACLEALETLDPSFNKSAVDAANKAAAEELGIHGQPQDWVWENWMQIEAVRGLPPQCYSCVLISTDIVPAMTTVQPDPSDYRIQAGFLGGESALRRSTSSSSSWRFWGDDYTLRATAFLWSGDRLNAPELLDRYIEIIGEYQTGGGVVLDSRHALNFSLEQGGYTWVPDTAWAEDQIFLMGQSWWSATVLQAPPVREAMMSRLFEIINEWQITAVGTPLRTYLASNSDRLLI